MEVLYLSTLCSKRLNRLFENKGQSLGYAIQKFNRLLALGLMSNDVKTISLTNIPVNGRKSNRKIWIERKESEDGITFKYLPFLNFPIIRQICLFLTAFFSVLFWGVIKRRNKAVVCDILNVSVSTAGLLACKIIGVKSVGVVTDMPGNMAMDKPRNINFMVAEMVNKKYYSSFDRYVFLTEQMSAVINTKQRPYIVMEGLVDSEAKIQSEKKDTPRTIFYAGGLLAIYGIQMLVDAVKLLPYKDIQLVLYGSGKMVDELKYETDSRIVYRGVATNDIIVEEERKATILVNPRPTQEKFTQYSFPSKNMEYMVSGTPLITTCLPGMPKEYYPYVYLFDEETTEGYARVLKEVLSYTSDALNTKGKAAQEFVLTKKNNITQAARLVNLIVS
jgi:glycosyltransferase involved in cell wall biosynthesis